MTNYEIPCKCRICSLHFTIWSERAGRDPAKVYCPECGVMGDKILFGVHEFEGFIFEKVPGPYRPSVVGMMMG